MSVWKMGPYVNVVERIRIETGETYFEVITKNPYDNFNVHIFEDESEALDYASFQQRVVGEQMRYDEYIPPKPQPFTFNDLLRGRKV